MSAKSIKGLGQNLARTKHLISTNLRTLIQLKLHRISTHTLRVLKFYSQICIFNQEKVSWEKLAL